LGECSGIFPKQLEEVADMTETQMIYVELLNEGVTVYRPIEATRDRDGSFRLPASAPADEDWRFEPGSRVVCELEDIGGEEPQLVATRSASSDTSVARASARR
jgi:hypothetical protein